MFAAILASLALAQPVPPTGTCGPGKNCKAATFTATNSSYLAMRNGSTSPKMCLNSSSGANNNMWTWYSLPANGNLYLSNTSNPASNLCAEGSTVLNFESATSTWTNGWVERHGTREEYQGAAISSLGTCSGFANPSLNQATDAHTLAWCNLKQWDNVATIGSVYQGGTVASPHPVLPTGVDLANTIAGPLRMEQCYVDPEGTANPTCTGFITPPDIVGGTGCGLNSADTTYNHWPLVKFNTDGNAGSYCSWSKSTGYVLGAMFPRIAFTWRMGSTAEHVRYWIGWRGDNATLFGSDTPSSKFCAFRFSSVAGDVNWQACSSSANGGAQSCTDTGIGPGTSAGWTHQIEVTPVGCAFRLYDRTYTLVYAGIKQTDLPSTTSKAFPIFGVEAVTGADGGFGVRSISFGKMTQEHQ